MRNTPAQRLATRILALGAVTFAAVAPSVAQSSGSPQSGAARGSVPDSAPAFDSGSKEALALLDEANSKNDVGDTAGQLDALRRMATLDPSQGAYYAAALFTEGTDQTGSGVTSSLPTKITDHAKADEAIRVEKARGTAEGFSTASAYLTALGSAAYDAGDTARGRAYFADARSTMNKVFDPAVPAEASGVRDRRVFKANEAEHLLVQVAWEPRLGSSALSAWLTYQDYLGDIGNSSLDTGATVAAYVRDAASGAIPKGTYARDYTPPAPANLPSSSEITLIAGAQYDTGLLGR